jgi:excisionase family DNA binding protein
MPRTSTYNDAGNGGIDPDSLLTIGEAAQILGFSIQTLRNWDTAGKLTAGRTPGGRRVYRYADVLAALEDMRGAA